MLPSPPNQAQVCQGQAVRATPCKQAGNREVSHQWALLSTPALLQLTVVELCDTP